jgi:hypothetical protein
MQMTYDAVNEAQRASEMRLKSTRFSLEENVRPFGCTTNAARFLGQPE